MRMKRKFVLCAVTLILAICVLFCACNKKDDVEPKSNVCRRTDGYLAGESESFAVSIESGCREKCFIADGKATDVIPFCEINITPLVTIDRDSISFALTDGEGNSLSGACEGGKFGEFCADITLDFTPTAVTVTAGEKSSEIELCDVLDGCITAADAINIAADAFKDALEKEDAEGKHEREIYVKVITGDRLNYYYYVSFIGDGVDYRAVLIDVKTGEIASKK